MYSNNYITRGVLYVLLLCKSFACLTSSYRRLLSQKESRWKELLQKVYFKGSHREIRKKVMSLHVTSVFTSVEHVTVFNMHDMHVVLDR